MSAPFSLQALSSAMQITPKSLCLSLEEFIREKVRDLERDGVVIGLSGGIDSAVAAALCARAVGPEKTLALLLPDKDSARAHIHDALDLARKLGIGTELTDITPLLRRLKVYRLFFLNKLPLPAKIRGALARKAHRYFEQKTGKTPFAAALVGLHDKDFGSYLKNSNAYYRVKHRVRMVMLYLRAERDNRLVVGAANKTECRIGFFVKHGCDHAADVMPLLNLYKTQVRELAHYLEIPPHIIEKAPSPDIIPGITDEAAIGIDYKRLDLILLALERGYGIDETADGIGVPEETVRRVKELTERSAHMREVYVPHF